MGAAPIRLRGAKGLLVFHICSQDFANKTKQAGEKTSLYLYVRIRVSFKTERLSPGVCVPLPSLDVKGFNFPNKMLVKPKPDGRPGLAKANRPFIRGPLIKGNNRIIAPRVPAISCLLRSASLFRLSPRQLAKNEGVLLRPQTSCISMTAKAPWAKTIPALCSSSTLSCSWSREKEIIARSVIRVCQNISEMRENSCLVRCHED